MVSIITVSSALGMKKVLSVLYVGYTWDSFYSYFNTFGVPLFKNAYDLCIFRHLSARLWN